MEQDKQLKHILLNSAERASADFTDTVMQQITHLSKAPAYDQPLVHPKLVKGFLFTFGAIVVSIFTLCLLMALPHVQVVSWLQNIKLTDLNYRRILSFLLIFWMVFSVNVLVEKKWLSRREPSF